jgi:hypothetical protein
MDTVALVPKLLVPMHRIALAKVVLAGALPLSAGRRCEDGAEPCAIEPLPAVRDCGSACWTPLFVNVSFAGRVRMNIRCGPFMARLSSNFDVSSGPVTLTASANAVWGSATSSPPLPKRRRWLRSTATRCASEYAHGSVGELRGQHLCRTPWSTTQAHQSAADVLPKFLHLTRTPRPRVSGMGAVRFGFGVFRFAWFSLHRLKLWRQITVAFLRLQTPKARHAPSASWNAESDWRHKH